MQIHFSPQRRDDSLVASVNGDILTVNGEQFDFASVSEGDTLPADAISSQFFSGPVERIGGVLHVTLLLPHGPNPSQAAAFPESVLVLDGPVPIPE